MEVNVSLLNNSIQEINKLFDEYVDTLTLLEWEEQLDTTRKELDAKKLSLDLCISKIRNGLVNEVNDIFNYFKGLEIIEKDDLQQLKDFLNFLQENRNKF